MQALSGWRRCCRRRSPSLRRRRFWWRLSSRNSRLGPNRWARAAWFATPRYTAPCARASPAGLRNNPAGGCEASSKAPSKVGSDRFGLAGDDLQDGLQIPEPERLFDQRRRPFGRGLLRPEFAAAQSDGRNSQMRTFEAEIDRRVRIEHHIGDDDINPSRRQRGRRFRGAAARFDRMPAIRQDAGKELTDAPIRLGEENARHRLPPPRGQPSARSKPAESKKE